MSYSIPTCCQTVTQKNFNSCRPEQGGDNDRKNRMAKLCLLKLTITTVYLRSFMKSSAYHYLVPTLSTIAEAIIYFKNPFISFHMLFYKQVSYTHALSYYFIRTYAIHRKANRILMLQTLKLEMSELLV